MAIDILISVEKGIEEMIRLYMGNGLKHPQVLIIPPRIFYYIKQLPDYNCNTTKYKGIKVIVDSTVEQDTAYMAEEVTE